MTRTRKMTRASRTGLCVVLVSLLVGWPALAQDTTTVRPQPRQHAPHFVDRNGDGYDDNAPDHDGDGIPNGVDPDFTGPRRGMRSFVDRDGNGYNDNAPDHDGDGLPNGVDPDFTGPRQGGGGRGFVDRDGDGINDNRCFGCGRGGRGRGGAGRGAGGRWRSN